MSAAADDTANAKTRALQYFDEIAVRLHELKVLHKRWDWEGLVDDPSEHIIQIRHLTAERDVAIQNLQQFGITMQDAEMIETQLCERWDASRNNELRQLAGINSSLSAPAEPVAPLPQQAPRTTERKELTDHERKIWEVSQRGVRGRLYCRELDRVVRVKQSWVDDGCPSTYLQAYDDADSRWRQRIQDEKSKVQRKAKLLSSLAD